MNEPKILSAFIETDEGKPLFPQQLKIKRGERVATYGLLKIRVVTKGRKGDG